MISLKKQAIYTTALGMMLCSGMTPAQELTQHYKKGDYLEVKKESELPKSLVQHSGSWRSDKVYTDIAYKVGLHINTGTSVNMNTSIRLGDGNTTHIIGIHGKGTEVKYGGKWTADGFNSFPNLVLSKGGRFVITKDAVIDLVLADAFYTRQIWAYGDGTGTIELEEGFIADRTEGGTVPNACGTIRLNGVNLISHHSQSLPYNTRPDGRGAVYHNGHIVWEGQPGSVWTVKTNPQIYRAQLDFHSNGTIDTQVPLVHAGQLRITDPRMVGGVFISTGAFRTCDPDVTITKTGPAMLALEGQQGYYPGSVLDVKEGVLRMTTNPALGRRYDKNAGDYLTLKIAEGASFVAAADEIDLEKLELANGAKLYLFPDTQLKTGGPVVIEANSHFNGMGIIKGDLTVKSNMTINPQFGLTVEGKFDSSEANVRFGYARSVFRSKPESVELFKAGEWSGSFKNFKVGDTVEFNTRREKVAGQLAYKDGVVSLVNLTYEKVSKKKKK